MLYLFTRRLVLLGVCLIYYHVQRYERTRWDRICKARPGVEYCHSFDLLSTTYLLRSSLDVGNPMITRVLRQIILIISNINLLTHTHSL